MDEVEIIIADPARQLIVGDGVVVQEIEQRDAALTGGVVANQVVKNRLLK